MTAAAAPSAPVLHAVTNDAIVARPDFPAQALRVMHAMGARGALHLRAARMARERAADLLALARTLATAQDASGAALVVTDRADIALLAGARAVQLTGDSMTVAQTALAIERAQRIAADGRLVDAPAALAIGASVHSLEEAIAARIAGARWGVAHDVADPARDTVQRVEALVRHSGLPIIAIGGVTPGHVARLRALGVHGVAVIRGIWDHENSERAVTDYLSAYDAPVGG